MTKEIEQLIHMYKDVFTSDNGKKVLFDLEARCSWRSSSYVQGDPNATAFEEGKRSVLLHIHNMLDKEK
jgi:hypothetical protein|tara:strand:- start:245 stop:451 length:207 start_codon:yes stop_codon:yes gene_type:complete